MITPSNGTKSTTTTKSDIEITDLTGELRYSKRPIDWNTCFDIIRAENATMASKYDDRNESSHTYVTERGHSVNRSM